MKFSIAFPFLYATLGLTVPVTEKRAIAQVTLFKETGFLGDSTTMTIDTHADNNRACFLIPTDFDNQVDSVKLNPSIPDLFCRVFDTYDCFVDNPDTSSFFFDADVSDLGTAANHASSIYCSTRSGN